jgi:hypothetical protein
MKILNIEILLVILSKGDWYQFEKNIENLVVGV